MIRFVSGPNASLESGTFPFLSPFRYPGGKSWLFPFIQQFLRCRGRPLDTFYEPFAGGASVGLGIAHLKLARKVHLVERDPSVAAVWKTIFSSDSTWLCKKIIQFHPTRQNLSREFERSSLETRQLAFQTLLRNRFLHGGILAPGAGLPRVGERGNGITSRWYPETLVWRINFIHAMRSRIIFTEGCGLEVIAEKSRTAQSFFFLDPPYTFGSRRAGLRLYTANEVDHSKPLLIPASLRNKFLLTYSDDPIARRWAKASPYDFQSVAMKGNINTKRRELLIFCSSVRPEIDSALDSSGLVRRRSGLFISSNEATT